MKQKLVIACVSIGLFAVHSASAANLMLDFGATTAASPYLTLSPGHNVGPIPAGQTGWNTITSSTASSSLLYADNTSASGVTLTMGQEATGGNNIISFATSITNTALVGTGGANIPTNQSLLGTSSIYGDASGTAVGRDGFFGGGTGTGTGAAIGLRVDGLAAGNYMIYVMARNTNTYGGNPMNVYLGIGASSTAYDFSSGTANSQSNAVYTTAAYMGEHNSFTAGENYVAISATITTGQSLFLASDGANSAVERRGFLNMVQIVQVPEPSACLLAGMGITAFLFRRRL